MRVALVALALVCSIPCGWAQQFEWANSVGGLGVDVGRCIQAMPDGGTVAGGSFAGSCNLGTVSMTGRGLTDGLIARYNATGDLLWATSMGGNKDDAVRGMACDPDGNVFVCGTFTDTIIFLLNDTDTVAYGSEGGVDMFVARYDANGNFIWGVTAGGDGEDMATAIVRHPDGTLYITGGFELRCTFGLFGALLSLGEKDMFMARYLPTNGTMVALAKGGGLAHDMGADIDIAPDWGVYVTGDFYEEATFATTHVVSNGSSDVFLAKYSYPNQLEWVQTAGGTGSDVATALATDLNNFAYVTGYFLGTTQFPCGTLTAQGYNDVFLAKYDETGQCHWAKSFGGSALDNALGMDCTWDGQVYITGLFDSELIADGDTAIGNGYDIFIAHFDPSGQHMFTKVAGAGSADIGQAIAVGDNGELFVTGYYYYYADFDEHTIGIAEYGDLFVAKLSHILGDEEPLLHQSNVPISVWPNPASDQITVRHNERTIKGLSLFDVRGRQVASMAGPGSRFMSFSVEGLLPGIYHLLIYLDGQMPIAQKVMLLPTIQ